MSWTQDGGNDAEKISERDREWMPHAVALTYLLHPFSILSCAGMSTIVLDHLLVSLAILTALRGLPVQANILLAVASHISPYFALSVPAVAIMLNKSRAGTSLVVSACLFTASISIIIAASGLALGSFDFITNVYVFVATVPDMLPNVGLFWYFFMEIFDHFQSFFLFIFQFHMAVYPIPLSMRLSHRPTFLALCLLAISAVFKSYPSIGDTCLCFALAPLFHRQVAGASSIYYLAQVLLFVSGEQHPRTPVDDTLFCCTIIDSVTQSEIRRLAIPMLNRYLAI
jgi:phosphatidylinositol glycan class U